ncbi:MAG: glycoside hydrolase family 88 protein [Deltaproteobacteria bacterium]|nr:glycoside hydrolase family 88 protein [Deltaproteobacteria bacterium]
MAGRRTFQALIAALLTFVLGVAACSDGGYSDSPTNEATLAVARGLADTWIAENAPADVDWSWGEGLLMLGLLELSRTTGDPRYEDYALDWLHAHQAAGYTIFWSDSCPPGTVASLLIGRRGATELQPIIDDVDTYLFEKAPRISDGGIAHLGFLPLVLKQQLWVDSLVMFGEFLIQTGLRSGDPRYLDLIAEQYEIFGGHLQHPTLGYWTHSWDDLGQQNHPPLDDQVFWGRGNAWALVAGYDLAAALPQGDPRRAGVLGRLARHEPAVRATQDPATGLYWTVLNRPGETYLESAGSAMISYAFARGFEEGFAGEDAVAAARRGLVGLQARVRVEESGRYVLSGTSVGTNPGPFWYYEIVPTKDNVSYGIGGFVLLSTRLVELERAGRIAPLPEPMLDTGGGA